MKLRGEVGVLRRQVDEFKKSALARAQTERDAKQQMASLKSEVEFARAKAQFKMDEIKSVNTLKQVLLACRLFAGDHNETYPTNFEQITFELGSLPTNSLSIFECVSAGMVNHVVSPRAVAFRERQPRQKLDENKWNRVYGLADGSVHVATSDDGNFDAWEKQNTEPPPANQ
jgi:hypothetical protein